MARSKQIVSRLFDTVGDGSGTKDATGSYGSLTWFKIGPTEAGEVYDMTRLIVSLSDSGTLKSDSYGDGITLTEGIDVAVIDSANTVLYRLTDLDHPIITNSDWGHYCYDVQVLGFGTGNPDEHLVVRWTFAKSGINMRLDYGEFLAIGLDDNFSGLLEHNFCGQGFRYRESKNVLT